jgi:glycosyltransferase involved in cell wall biosynthesis
MLKRIKTERKNSIIFMEIPTFPYDKEMLYRQDGTLANYPFYWKDLFWRTRFKKVIDYIVTPSETDDQIWDIPVLNISNGILVEDYMIRHPIDNKDIDLLAIANFKEWHGYERIINAIYNYHGDRSVKLHMIGEGTELKRYKELVNKYHLNDKVFFYGRKNMKEAEELFDLADIGLCSFGAYKKDLFYSKELKSREYLAKGLPVISGCELDILKEGDDGYLMFPNNKSSINLIDIINFYDSLYTKNDRTELALKLRNLAIQKFDMKQCMRSVIDKMKSFGIC